MSQSALLGVAHHTSNGMRPRTPTHTSKRQEVRPTKTEEKRKTSELNKEGRMFIGFLGDRVGVCPHDSNHKVVERFERSGTNLCDGRFEEWSFCYIDARGTTEVVIQLEHNGESAHRTFTVPKLVHFINAYRASTGS